MAGFRRGIFFLLFSSASGIMIEEQKMEEQKMKKSFWQITQAADAEGRFIQQIKGHGAYAVVRLFIDRFPNKKKDYIVFESEVLDDAVPKEFIKAVERGIRTAAINEVLGNNHPLINIKATLLAVRHHELDSSEYAFERAGEIAFLNAIREAKPVFERS